MTKRISAVVVIVLLVVYISQFVIWVAYGREAERRMTSMNNLRQIGNAILNFESAFKSLPPGCDEQERHGWMTWILPFKEQEFVYGAIDRQLSWDHPLNRHLFSTKQRGYNNPRESRTFTSEGFFITGYHANPALFHRGSQVKLTELASELSNTWMAGEIQGNFTPYGYPYNWRLLDSPINSGPNSFGGWPMGGSFLFADGSVRQVAKDIDHEILQRMAEAAPLPSEELYRLPNRSFTLLSKSGYLVQKFHVGAYKRQGSR